MNILRWIESAAWIAGVALLAIYAGARASSERARVDGIAAIEHTIADVPARRLVELVDENPDVSSWSPARIVAWRKSAHARGRPLAVLRIPSVDLSVPVFDGTTETNLNRGAARIEGTARIGGQGNLGLAAHRDGYFRALKDVRIGDDVRLTTPQGALAYRVVNISIVEPDAMAVLAPGKASSVTLVTCYPFYFVGSAPQRFIVRAELMTSPTPPGHEAFSTQMSR